MASRVFTISGVAPFCGPYTCDAPSGPVRGLLTSQATIVSVSKIAGCKSEISIDSNSAKPSPPRLSDVPSPFINFTPSASAMPAPPSFVALPPIPIIIRLHPKSKAALISCPVPKVVVCKGFLLSGGTRVRPDADAISITAVFPSDSMPNSASTSFPSGPRTRSVLICPPVASTRDWTVPSPPSAIGIFSIIASGNTRWSPCSIAFAASNAVTLPLNESGATTIFITVSLLYGA